MRKIWFLVIAFLSVSAAGRAQDFSIGPKFGVSQGNIQVDGDGYESGSEKLGYHVGAFVRMGGNSLYLQPEVLYVNTGGEIKESQGDNERTYEASFNRFDVPIMLGFKLGDVFRIQGGPVASFLLNSKFKNDIVPDPEPEYKNATVGYQAGIGFDIANMIIDLKYEGSLSKQSESIAGFDTDQRQNQLIVSLGLRLF
ncbi:PorT family protein [Echinicola strongylocentroti]|uniref:PorT family protein n=1 Tax=Echinicola strongylocentroti TaxID=1795355 RepID=A0A2Z4IK11_9BACT|nr:porin family protein [Echinicola strongylocentroti]AWW31275.1 PorT family protein [Echinicola strongylocentroti]